MTSRPPISGRIWSPEPVGLAPLTTCRNKGRYVTEPNNAKPTIRPIALVTVNTRLANSRGGSTGSAAPRSTTTNSTSRTIAAEPSVTINGEPHL